MLPLILTTLLATPPIQAPLPPPPPWDGSSRALVAAADDPWATPAEVSGLTATPDAATTGTFIDRLVAADARIRRIEIGRSHEGRAVELLVVSQEGVTDPAGLRATGRPTLLIQNGIHAGEIDGKDASLMLLRDLVLGRHGVGDLTSQVNLLIVPILNIDGHERASRWSRPNQRGPELQGWRTNARNQNLNRDWAKLDAPETRAVVEVLRDWPVDLWFDVHVTDGIDYEYDITYGWNGHHGRSPAIAGWLERRLRPEVDAALEARGHVPGPLIFAVDDLDPTKGIADWTSTPRFSNGYGDARHLASVLVENHSLKPYDQRVLGTRVLLEATARTLAAHARELREATRVERARARERFVLTHRRDEGEPRRISFRGIRRQVETSPITGAPVVRWLGEPELIEVPVITSTTPDVVVDAPLAWWVPPSAGDAIAVLEIHGIEMERIPAPREVEVEIVRLPEAALAPRAFEARARVEPGPLVSERRRETFPAGSVRVRADQPLAELAALLLEPASPDSFLQWGFFLGILHRTEYLEAYVLEPLAAAMLDADAELRAEWEAALAADEALRNDPQRRLAFFAERSAYVDQRYRVHPIAREVAVEPVP
jgi:hypothetical protein